MSAQELNVIALISGGKDSFFSLLHCLHHGHRVVALANLAPAAGGSNPSVTQFIDPDEVLPEAARAGDAAADEEDLNSFMYQTVGHDLVPLYAAATGLPLYRQPILGKASCQERDYDYAASSSEVDETESMLPLLQTVMNRHPEANAVCSGAILSTYQRTRVESIALRLGLTPLSYLWKYPILPGPEPLAPADDAQLLRDMAAAGLDARLIKVASAGLDEDFLWQRVTSSASILRVGKALRRFGAALGACLGEGGEFETIVVDGPSQLFTKRIVVPDEGRKVVSEGGGSFWLALRGARLEAKHSGPEEALRIREPNVLDDRYQRILDTLLSTQWDAQVMPQVQDQACAIALDRCQLSTKQSSAARTYLLMADADRTGRSIREEVVEVVDRLRALLSTFVQGPMQVAQTFILRDMAEFPTLNRQYASLFKGANPPSRVTVSCGDLLPLGRNVVVYVAMCSVSASLHRDGLHVQSRSYWAPANIGPYSQAISVPVTEEDELSDLQAVYVAGQIPLIPASMELPAPAADSLPRQVVLSLQHLGRIGSDMKVQMWTSAVAYFARCSSPDEMLRRARYAVQAWRQAHADPDTSPEKEKDHFEAGDGPDLWDRKHNPEYSTLGHNDSSRMNEMLSDWTVFDDKLRNEPASLIPPVFSVEVESLPRQAAVEWHAQMGLRGVERGSCHTTHLSNLGEKGWNSWHFTTRRSTTIFMHSTIALEASKPCEQRSFAELALEMDQAFAVALQRLRLEEVPLSIQKPSLSYINRSIVGESLDECQGQSLPIIPCHSIWSSYGRELACVAFYRTLFSTQH